MAGPWERYQPAGTAEIEAPVAAGPWTRFQPSAVPTPPAAPVAPTNLPVPTEDPAFAAEPAFGSPEWLQATFGGVTGQAATGGVEGAGTIFDLPAIAEKGLRSIGPGISNAVFGTDFAMPEDTFLPPLGSNLVGAIDDAGMLADDPDGWMETIFRRTGQELGAAALPIVGGAASAARPGLAALKDLGVTVGSGVGAGVAQNFVGDDGSAPAVLGDMAGQVIGGLGAGGLMSAARTVATPFPNSPIREEMAQTLQGEGVSLTAGQRTGNQNLRNVESELGGARAGDLMDEQAEQFTRATLERAGIVADRATPEVMDAAFARIGNDFDTLISQSTMPLDQQLATDLMQTVDDYDNFVPGGMQAPVVQHVVEGLSNQLNTAGMLDGATYQAYRSQIDRAARGAGANPYLQEALYGIRNAMDDAVERGLAQTNPDAVEMWRQARTEYRNIIAIEKAASRAGENSAMGLITPANLRNAAQGQNKRDYVRGNGDFADLARSGVATMTPLPNSGTAGRTAARNMFAAAPAGIGALVGGNAAGGTGALAGVLAGAAAPKLAGAAIMSRPGQAYLGNQVFRPSGQSASPIGPLAGAIGQQGPAAEETDPVMELLMRGSAPPSQGSGDAEFMRLLAAMQGQ